LPNEAAALNMGQRRPAVKVGVSDAALLGNVIAKPFPVTPNALSTAHRLVTYRRSRHFVSCP
jgi:hypothetical protein